MEYNLTSSEAFAAERVKLQQNTDFLNRLRIQKKPLHTSKMRLIRQCKFHTMKQRGGSVKDASFERNTHIHVAFFTPIDAEKKPQRKAYRDKGASPI